MRKRVALAALGIQADKGFFQRRAGSLDDFGRRVVVKMYSQHFLRIASPGTCGVLRSASIEQRCDSRRGDHYDDSFSVAAT
jgi:hypothetical protein